MSTARPLPTTSPGPAPAIAPLEWLRHLEEHVPVAREGSDAEGVHQLRVAAGHLDVWLRLAGWTVLRGDLRWLRHYASSVRDFDVLLAGSPPAAWVPWLRRRRAEARGRLVLVLDAPRLPALVRALSLVPPLAKAAATRGVAKLARRALKEAERLEKDPRDLERLHALRRDLRRLRYGLEWIGEPTSELKRLQDAFGALNDLAVALRIVGEYRLRARLADWTRGLEGKLAAARDQALGVWVQERERVVALAE
jgi:CHAD domain-containing protein